MGARDRNERGGDARPGGACLGPGDTVSHSHGCDSALLASTRTASSCGLRGPKRVSLDAVGRKVDVVERAIRRGTGHDPELAEVLARDEAGDYRE